MSMERCWDCSRAVDTDEDVEGFYGTLPENEKRIGRFRPVVYICARCLEKNETVTQMLWRPTT